MEDVKQHFARMQGQEISISDTEIERGLQDIRVMACARSAYEAYRDSTHKLKNWSPPSWYRLLEKPDDLYPWIAAALAALKTWKSGNTGSYERPDCGTGRWRRPTDKISRPQKSAGLGYR